MARGNVTTYNAIVSVTYLGVAVPGVGIKASTGQSGITTAQGTVKLAVPTGQNITFSVYPTAAAMALNQVFDTSVNNLSISGAAYQLNFAYDESLTLFAGASVLRDRDTVQDGAIQAAALKEAERKAFQANNVTSVGGTENASITTSNNTINYIEDKIVTDADKDELLQELSSTIRLMREAENISSNSQAAALAVSSYGLTTTTTIPTYNTDRTFRP